jgi:hypothetical protein
MAGKEFPGQKGFPTPDDTPAEQGYLLFEFPDSNDWAGLLLGAADALTYAYNFYNWGEMLPEEASEAWRLIVNQAPYNLIERDVPAPYWDNPEDVDDEEPPDEQPWYGKMEGLDFVEEIGIWAITGFIAYSGQIGAAIAFKTFAPKFALAWKRGGVAAAIEVFVDGVSTGELEIGSGEGIVEQNFIGDPELEEHDIRVVLNSVA